MMTCPICRQQMKPGWVTTDPEAKRWFVGTYTCPSHGEMRLSGQILDDGPKITSHIPECPRGCGVMPVVQISSTRWNCASCGRAITIRNGRLITWPDPIATMVARQLAAV